METKREQPSYSAWIQGWLKDLPAFFLRPVTIIREYDRGFLSADLIAGLTVAFVMLPQAIAFALVADLPAETGLYAAIIATFVGALWGSSWHLSTGPTNTTSLIVLSTLGAVVATGTPEYVTAAALMAVMVGIIRLLMGLARLGALVNFVSDAVIVGFATGAAILIGVNQLRHLLRLEIATDPAFLVTASRIVRGLPTTHWPSAALGIFTIVLSVLLRRYKPSWPIPLIGMVVASLLVAFLGLDAQGVIVLGELPRTFPPFRMPPFSKELMNQLLTGSVAVALIGLIEAMSIGQTLAVQSGQRIDSNQEFIGQGIANIVTGFFSGYTSSGSFTRSALTYESGAKSSLASVFASIFVLIMLLLFAPYAAFLPRTALAGIIILIALRMINRERIMRVVNTAPGDTLTMVATMVATLVLPLKFAVLAGIIVSFVRYINKTASPEVTSVVPDATFEHFVYNPNNDVCPQLAVITISGSLYFGATSHVDHEIRDELEGHPDQIYALLRLQRVNHVDISGINLLESLLKMYRSRGGDLFVTGMHEDVFERLEASGFVESVGRSHFLPQNRAIAHIFYKVLDPARCIYHCKVRVWKECQTLPKSALDCTFPKVISDFEVEHISAETLKKEMQTDEYPLVIDVRELSEYTQGHIPYARLVPLPEILKGEIPAWDNANVVITCRSSRRSMRAARAIFEKTERTVRILDNGMIAWHDAGFAEVIGKSRK